MEKEKNMRRTSASGVAYIGAYKDPVGWMTGTNWRLDVTELSRVCGHVCLLHRYITMSPWFLVVIGPVLPLLLGTMCRLGQYPQMISDVCGYWRAFTAHIPVFSAGESRHILGPNGDSSSTVPGHQQSVPSEAVGQTTGLVKTQMSWQICTVMVGI